MWLPWRTHDSPLEVWVGESSQDRPSEAPHRASLQSCDCSIPSAKRSRGSAESACPNAAFKSRLLHNGRNSYSLRRQVAPGRDGLGAECGPARRSCTGVGEVTENSAELRGIRDEGEQSHLLVTDVVMPSMNGREPYLLLKRRRLASRVPDMSGHPSPRLPSAAPAARLEP
jgi:hypothetical protein